MCLCNKNFQSKYATIKSLQDNNDILNGTIISIDEYIENNELRAQVKQKMYQLFCKNGHRVKPYISKKIISHFKHINYSDETGGLMSYWHNRWQGEFYNIEVPHSKLDSCYKKRIADVLVGNIVIEFQHSYISQEEVEHRVHDYLLHGRKVHWIIDCNENFKVDYLEVSNTYMLSFTSNTWKYESFINQKYIYLHHNNNIYKIEPTKVKSNMIDVRECKDQDLFIDAYKSNFIDTLWNDNELPQCTLYHNQRGAGCGKTYESIQLLSNDERFQHKRTFIYLTKAHSAKEVIYNEFMEQHTEGKLINIDMCDNNIEVSGKQYKLSYKDLRSREDCCIIIGTIDSFMYALGNKQNKQKDFFEGLIESIKLGHLEVNSNGVTKYARSAIHLNKKCLLLIDETQDLNKNYIEAIAQIMRNTYIDAYIIGDKLQSIWGEENIYTYLEQNDLPNTNKVLSIGQNHVRRFHNTGFISFVNSIIDFNKYNLNKISAICDGSHCQYIHEDDVNPVTLLRHDVIYNEEKDNKKLNNLIEKIISFIKQETLCYKYLPKNFMFIFPIMRKNALASMLETKLQEFWVSQFASIEYQEQVLSKNTYWKTRINNGEFYKYVYLHKSDENKPINTKESENATRILSIHSSKGLGCEVVFLFNLTEEALKRYSVSTGNLVYDSLLHVAITRQKKKLYIGVANNNDEINVRLLKTNNELINIQISTISGISSYNKMNDICNYVKLTQYNTIRNVFAQTFTRIENISGINSDEHNEQKTTLDWGHHVIRYCVFCYSLMCNIINDNTHNKCADSKQYMTIINKISKLTVKTYHHTEYHNELKRITELNRDLKNECINIFPVLTFCLQDAEVSMYQEYHNVIIDTIHSVQHKSAKQIPKNKLPFLCPLEMLILVHMMKVHNKGIYNEDVSIMDVYNIVQAFHVCWNTSGASHSDFNCKCDKHFSLPLKDKFSVNNDIAVSIKSHHEIVSEINIKYNCFKESWNKIADNEVITYNIDHTITLNPKNSSKSFSIWNPNITFIGNSENYVVYTVMKPALNKMNYNDVIIDCIFNTYLIQNSKKDTNNYERFCNKKVIICIYTFSKTIPIIFELNTDIGNDVIKQILSSFLYDKYSKYNEKIINLYKYLKENRKDKTKSGLDMLIEKVENITPEPLDYVKNFLVIQKENMRKMRVEERQKLISLENINNFLRNTIDNYLFENEVEEYDY